MAAAVRMAAAGRGERCAGAKHERLTCWVGVGGALFFQTPFSESHRGKATAECPATASIGGISSRARRTFLEE